MGFTANIDIAVSFSKLKITSIRQQGYLKYRICLFYESAQSSNDVKGKNISCHPYSIIKRSNTSQEIGGKSSTTKHKEQKNKKIQLQQFNGCFKSSQLKATEKKNEKIQESQIDLDSQYYISRTFKVKCQKQSYQIMETCCFRTYVDVEDYEKIQLKCLIEILFCSEFSNSQLHSYKVIGRCQCKIRKMFDISTFLPLVFDEFEGVSLEGVYQAALIDFHFEKNNDFNAEEQPQNRHSNFYQYLKQITNGFNRLETRNFYNYYRNLLEKQLFSIQQRHFDLLRVLKLNRNAQEHFRMLKINNNTKIISMIDHLEGYNSFRDSSKSFQKQILSKNHKITLSKQESHKSLIAEEIMFDFLSIKAHIFSKWQIYLEFTSQFLIAITKKYKHNYDSLVKDRFSSNVFSHLVESKDWKYSAYQDSGSQNLQQAEVDKQKMLKDEEQWKDSFIIENQKFFGKHSQNVKIFQEIYEVKNFKQSVNGGYKNRDKFNQEARLSNFETKQTLEKKKMFERRNSFPLPMLEHELENPIKLGKNDMKDNQDHFVVLVHGFQASRQDFMILKNCLEIRFKVKVFISTVNEGRTEEEIQVLGKRFALELQRFLNDNTPSINYKLSFIGHSMGGIIIRSALCFLVNIDRHLYSFITFSTPHIGYLYQTSTHIQAGLWLMNSWQKIESIEQLCMRDDEDLRGCYLYKLSKSRTLNKFKQIAFVGSYQDKYVPYQSARLELNHSALWDRLNYETCQVLTEMTEGLIGNLQNCKSFSRMNVIFNIEDNNLDSFIGRTAHIKYLSDRHFIKTFCIVFDRFFT